MLVLTILLYELITFSYSGNNIINFYNIFYWIKKKEVYFQDRYQFIIRLQIWHNMQIILFNLFHKLQCHRVVFFKLYFHHNINLDWV